MKTLANSGLTQMKLLDRIASTLLVVALGVLLERIGGPAGRSGGVTSTQPHGKARKPCLGEMVEAGAVLLLAGVDGRAAGSTAPWWKLQSKAVAMATVRPRKTLSPAPTSAMLACWNLVRVLA